MGIKLFSFLLSLFWRSNMAFEWHDSAEIFNNIWKVCSKDLEMANKRVTFNNTPRENYLTRRDSIARGSSFSRPPISQTRQPPNSIFRAILWGWRVSLKLAEKTWKLLLVDSDFWANETLPSRYINAVLGFFVLNLRRGLKHIFLSQNKEKLCNRQTHKFWLKS